MITLYSASDSLLFSVEVYAKQCLFICMALSTHLSRWHGHTSPHVVVRVLSSVSKVLAESGRRHRWP